MQREDIGDRMLPTVIDDHRAIPVNTLGQIVDTFREMLLPLTGLHLTDSPGFIKRRPCNDTGMIVILLHDLQPLSRELFHRVIRKIISSRHLTPYQHTLHITPV